MSKSQRLFHLVGFLVLTLGTLFVFLEVGCGVWLKYDLVKKFSAPVPYTMEPFPWKDDLWKEQQSYALTEPNRYQAYVGWTLPPYRGKYLHNVRDADNTVRRTIPPHEAECQGKPQRQIWLFGGSTAWGWGNPDELTPASLISKKLNEQIKTACFHVKNFGVPGYNSTQDAIYLSQLLLRRAKPDYVILLNGGNDSVWGFVPDEGPYRHGFFNRAETLFSKMSSLQVARRATLFREWVQSFAISETVKRLREGISIAVPRARRGKDTGVVTDILHNYRANLDQVEFLAKKYGFAVFPFWQPMQEYPYPTAALPSGLQRVYDAAEKSAQENPRFVFLGRIFENEGAAQQNNFIDLLHLTVQGNHKVAQAIVDHLKPQITTPFSLASN